MAGRFRVLTDACVNDHFVGALRDRGWDVVRAIDLYPERTSDEVLFERAAVEGRVFVTNDRPAEAIAIRWLREDRRFSGMIVWPVGAYGYRSTADLVADLEALANEDDPFAYPIRHLRGR